MDRRLLEQCEKEPLRFSGMIEAQGALLVVDRDGRVTHASTNCAALLGRSAEDWLGQALPEDYRDLLDALDTAAGSRCLRVFALPQTASVCDVVAQRMTNGGAVVEFLPYQPCDLPQLTPAVPPTIADTTALASARQALVEEIAATSGFQRVMFYAFYADGDGEVIAEVHDQAAYGSYLGLRFPASDIPQIARDLYLKNPWRLIPDSQATPVAVQGIHPQPPDLTWSVLRSVSPVHRVYLANMGVVASLSFPVVVNGQLAALVAAHHRTARHPPIALLEYLAGKVRDFALAWAAFQSQERVRLLDTLDYRLAPVRNAWRRHGDLFSAWPEMAATLLELARADGATLCIADTAANFGMTLRDESLAVFDTWFREQGNMLWQCDSIVRSLPELALSEVSGVFGLRTRGTGGSDLRLYLFRREHIYEVAWGGNPNKPVEYHDGRLGIAPRRSFEKWIEKRIGYCRPWENEVRLLLLRMRDLLQVQP